MSTITDKNQENTVNKLGNIVLKKSFWHRSTPTEILTAIESGQTELAVAWSKHLTTRKLPITQSKLFASETEALGWCLPNEQLNEQTISLVKKLDAIVATAAKQPSEQEKQSTDEIVLPWLAETEDQPASLDIAYQAVAWARAMPQLILHLEFNTWFSLLLHLTKIADEAVAVQLTKCPLTQQLLAGELPLSLALAFPEMNSVRNLFELAKENLTTALVETTDGQGLVHHRDLNHFRPLVACWVRCVALSKANDQTLLSEDATAQFHWTVTSLLRLTRFDGSQMLTNHSAGSWNETFFVELLKLAGNEDDHRVANLLLPNRKSDEKSARKIGRFKAGHESEWSGLAIMRPKWKPSGIRLLTTYGDDFLLELDSGNGGDDGDDDVVISGPLQTTITVGGKELKRTSQWQQACWTSDHDVDYLELQADFENGYSVERHLLLARKDRFLFFADAIRSESANKKKPQPLEYRCDFPLGENIAFETVAETSECYLMGNKPRGLVLPLALNEWQCDNRFGKLESTNAIESGKHFTLTQTTEAKQLFCPLFIDLSARRMVKELTWRQLTVAHEREVEANDQAVGYRIQLGKRQWLIYRSLAEKKCRTLLGHHVSSEFLVSRFSKKPVGNPLVETEG